MRFTKHFTEEKEKNNYRIPNVVGETTRNPTHTIKISIAYEAMRYFFSNVLV